MKTIITENLVRDILKNLHYYDEKDIVIEEQRSQIEEIRKLLKNASKNGGGGIGSPEFIVTSYETPDFIVIFECKSDIKSHRSPNLDKPRDFAVDGALHYAKSLSQSYNVIAVAVSGQTTSALRVTNYFHPKGSKESKVLMNKAGFAIEEILPLDEYINNCTFDPEVARRRHADLMAFSRELHDFLRDQARLTESEKPLLVSGTLIALRNKAFAKSFDAHTPESLQKEWIKVIREELVKAEIPFSKEENMTQPYSSISVHPELGKSTTKFPRGVLFEVVKMLNEKVSPFISIYHDFDVVGQFYGEFLKYTGGDKKGLGIVLTPRHITELFALLANVQKDSRVLDICAGTGGFLISAMYQMLKQASTDKERQKIKNEGLVGVEQQPNMYALAASNMILRGDGKANLHQGSCFDEAIVKAIKEHKCNVGMLNPPYSQGDEALHELAFVRQLLDCLVKDAIGIVIVPMSCAISPHPLREEILKHHTLDAVMSMPDDLFYPVGTVTCIMVFKAHQPHAQANRKTWFGYWKNDGYIKTKYLGRMDIHGTWDRIKERWVVAYRNRDDITGISVKKMVTATDEWCAEAYMETDYSRLSSKNFEKVVRDYAVFSLLHKKSDSKDSNIKVENWKWFQLQDLFEIKKGKRLTKLNMKSGSVPFIGAIESENGYRQYIDIKANHEGNTITVNYNGSVGEAFYQPISFWASDDVNVLYPKFKLNQYIGLFICSVIRNEKYRFNYGRKWHVERMLGSKIKLPADNKGRPDYLYMEEYIRKLPLGSSI